ncbi:type VI secretion protein [Thaumasiovibrio subtropicus]|uniref:type VI secretion protein n=1 Tax=Thaumasiovibrio subtropicus TaxID=1891207 RepID=UPI000B35BCF1|nr:type VI secretion protein [Thaumasiovibrio subtropicus]
MSLIRKLNENWHGDGDDVREAIVDNISSLISSRAPIWTQDIGAMQLGNTIAVLGMQNTARSQSKVNSDVVLQEVKALILKYENRLTDVQLEANEESVHNNQLEFRISAVMHSDFGSEVIVVDSFLDFSTSKLDVRKTNLV